MLKSIGIAGAFGAFGVPAIAIVGVGIGLVAAGAGAGYLLGHAAIGAKIGLLGLL